MRFLDFVPGPTQFLAPPPPRGLGRAGGAGLDVQGGANGFVPPVPPRVREADCHTCSARARRSAATALHPALPPAAPAFRGGQFKTLALGSHVHTSFSSPSGQQS